MKKKPQLYVHIGHAKTGSSTIQTFLNDNRKILANEGFLASTSTLSFEADIDDDLPPLSFFNHLTKDDSGSEHLRKALESGLRALEKIDGHSLIISSENLCIPGAAALFKNLEDLVDIRIIYYIRRHDDLILASWKQWISKTGSSFEDYVAKRLIHRSGCFQDVVKDWDGVKGVTDIQVRPLHVSALHNKELCDDVALWLGLPLSGLIKTPPVNVSLNYNYSVLLGKTPQLFSSIHSNEVTNYVKKQAPDLVCQPSGEVMGYKTREAIYRLYHDDYIYIYDRFFPHLDFDSIFGISHIPDDIEPYRPSPITLIYKSFGLLLKLLYQNHNRMNRLAHRISLLEKDKS